MVTTIILILLVYKTLVIIYTTLVFLPGFSTLGSTEPIEKLKGGHEGEKWVTI